MRRKEIQAVIDANLGKPLYLFYGNPQFISVHQPISKTKVLRNAKIINSYRTSTFGEERPDLQRYGDRPNGLESLGWNNQIVTFDATTREEN